MKNALIKQNELILFQGDSITDAGRNRNEAGCLGYGYANMVAAYLQMSFPAAGLRFINRGVSGDRVADMLERWQEDCITVRPDWLFILAGINNVWRRFDSADPTTAELFEMQYRELLEKSRVMAGLRIVVLEPFVLPVPADRENWREDLDEKIGIIRKLARQYADAYIPLDGLLSAATVGSRPEFWAADGVHPTNAGHALIARQIIGYLCGR